ncbi:MAG TPA: hypothetical protein VGN12_01495 [Pirellulales bacterium]
MELAVYNLEFPLNCKTLSICGDEFSRVVDYPSRFRALQHLVSVHDPEGSREVCTGGHAHTANATTPNPIPPAAISWGFAHATALDDILLLLSLFTQRDVFVVDLSRFGDKPFAILADPRCFPWGGVLSCSVPFKGFNPTDNPTDEVDIGLLEQLPKIYERLNDEKWRKGYRNGYFLVLLKIAMQQRSLEIAFSQCWTIWEHLFACLNDAWMSNASIERLSAKEKIAFLLVHFGVRVELQKHEKSRLDDLVAIRNRLVHYGRFPDRDFVRQDAEMFVRITEYVAAKILGLYPSNVFNTVERLEEFLSAQKRVMKTGHP